MMNSDKFMDLPDWDDERLKSYDDSDGEGWKPNLTRAACKALYARWQAVVFLLNGIIDPFIGKEDTDDSMLGFAARDMCTNAYIVGVKIMSSEAGNSYTLRMENAAIVRQCAQGIATGLLLFATEASDVDGSYVTVVRAEIDQFRLLFIQWVNTFERDEFTDSWGLFI
jgi:hypothetical protein